MQNESAALNRSVFTTREEYDTTTYLLEDNSVVVNPKNDSCRGYSRVHGAVMKTAIALLIGVIIIIAAIVAPSSQRPAQASITGNAISAVTDKLSGIFCAVGASNGSTPEASWSGTSGLFSLGSIELAGRVEEGIRLAQFDPSKPYTAYEKYGTAGTNWTFNREEIEGIQEYSCFPVDKVIANLSANSIFGITEAIVGFTGWVYGFAIGHDSFSDLIAAVDRVLGTGNDQGLINSLYLNYLTPLIILGSLWLFWYAFVKRAISVASTGIIWMLLSPIVSLGILYNASGLISLGNGLVQGVVTETTGAIGGITKNTRTDMPNEVGDLCHLPGASGNRLSSDSSGQVQRVVSCRIWEAFVYYPWATGQYGIPPTHGNLQAEGVNTTIKLGPGNEQKMDLRAAQLDSQALDYSLTQDQVKDGAPKKKQETYKKIEEHITTSEETDLLVNSWVGNEGMNRVSISVFSIIAVIGGTIVIISISVSMIIYQLGTIFLMLVAPLFLLLGIHPGFGRGIALKWAELLVESILKRVVLAIFLSVLIAIFMFLVGNTGQVGFMETVFLLVALSIAGMQYKGKFLDLVGNLQFGGTQTGLESGRGKVRSALLGTAGAAAGVLGAAGGIGAAGSMARAGAAAQGASKVGQAASAAAAAVKAGAKPAYGGYVRGSHSKSGAGALTKGFMGGLKPFNVRKGAGPTAAPQGAESPVSTPTGAVGGPAGVVGGPAGVVIPGDRKTGEPTGDPSRRVTPDGQGVDPAQQAQRQFLIDEQKARQDMKDGLLYGVSPLLSNLKADVQPRDVTAERPQDWTPPQPAADRRGHPVTPDASRAGVPSEVTPVSTVRPTPRGRTHSEDIPTGAPGESTPHEPTAGRYGTVEAPRPAPRGRTHSEDIPTVTPGDGDSPTERDRTAGPTRPAARDRRTSAEKAPSVPKDASRIGGPSSAGSGGTDRSGGPKRPHGPVPRGYKGSGVTPDITPSSARVEGVSPDRGGDTDQSGAPNAPMRPTPPKPPRRDLPPPTRE